MPRLDRAGCSLVAVAVAVAVAACATVLLLSGGRALGAAVGPAPSCATGPVVVGDTVRGTPCDDRIVAPPDAAVIEAGGGDDTIVASPLAAAVDCSAGCFLGIGSQTLEGGPGNDVIYGERGNDRIHGNAGDDLLFGGIGDDLLEGGPGEDRLSGGFGADTIDGGAGDDHVRGDATIDRLSDSGGGVDTISYSTGTPPGFFEHPGLSAVPGLPPLGGERGVYLDLSADPQTLNGDNGVADFAGGIDEVDGSGFEVVIGTPFSDYIVGGDGDETFYGGGGGDAIFGGGGDDALFGGADGDHLDGGGGDDTIDGGPGEDGCDGAAEQTSCEPAAGGGVIGRDQTKVSVGRMAPAGAGIEQLYLSGSEAADEVTATYSPGPPASVGFALGPGSAAPFDTDPDDDGGCGAPSGGQVVCQLGGALDSVVLAGFAGDDELSVSGFPPTVGLVLTGGDGDDSLTGSDRGEDVLVGGAGEDRLESLAGDDALLNNAGDDELFGGTGNDLFVSNSICDADTIDGGGQRDNASWTRYKDGGGVAANLAAGLAGAPGPGGEPACPGGQLTVLVAIEDLEGTPQGDVFTGDGADNQLLGWSGADTYAAGAGEDRVLANSGDFDPPVSCGPDDDVALIDFASEDFPPDVAEPDCEHVREAAKNSFRVEPEPEPEPESQPVTPAPAPKPKPAGTRTRPSCLGVTRSSAHRTTTRCAVRPRRLRLTRGGRAVGLRWRWRPGRAVGFGRLVVHARAGSFSARAKLVANRSRSCRDRPWYTRLRVLYGPGFRRAYLRRATLPVPCPNRLRRDGHRRGQRR